MLSRDYTCWISLKSWLTSIMPPSNSLIASAKASIVSISRWLVGSSRNSMWGFCQASQAKQTLHFWPSDKFLIGLTWRELKGGFKQHWNVQRCTWGTLRFSLNNKHLPAVFLWGRSDQWSFSSPLFLWSQGNTSSCTLKERGQALAALSGAVRTNRTPLVNRK